MADETTVDETQARILGALKDEKVAPINMLDATDDAPKVATKEAEEEVVEAEDKESEVVEKTKSAIDKKREFNAKVFDVKGLSSETQGDNIDWKAKAQEYEGKVKQFETKIEQEKRYEEETSVFTAIKEANGPRWTPAVDEAVAELIESNDPKKESLYDRLLKNPGITAQERMLLITNTALQMVEEPEKKLRTETVRTVKDMGKVNVADIKGEANRKRSAKEAMESYKRTGDDKDLNDAMGVGDILEGIFGNR